MDKPISAMRQLCELLGTLQQDEFRGRVTSFISCYERLSKLNQNPNDHQREKLVLALQLLGGCCTEMIKKAGDVLHTGPDPGWFDGHRGLIELWLDTVHAIILAIYL